MLLAGDSPGQLPDGLGFWLGHLVSHRLSRLQLDGGSARQKEPSIPTAPVSLGGQQRRESGTSPPALSGAEAELEWLLNCSRAKRAPP
jgi:hypothetical protein